MKKKIAAVLLLAALVAGLTGCQAKQNPEFSMGFWTVDQFRSAFADLAFNLPQGWEATDADTLAQRNAEADKALDLVQGGDGADPASIYHYELSAKDPVTGNGVQLLVQKYGMKATDYADGLKTGAEAEGANYTVSTGANRSLSGHPYIVLSITMPDAEAPYQRQYIRKTGDYLINIMFFSTQEGAESLDAMEEYFTTLG